MAHHVPTHLPWWGEGESPSVRWPGISLDFQAQWSPERDRWETHQGRYYFDTREADHVAKFFPLFLRHHMGEFAGLPFELRADQAQLLVRPLFGWKRSSDGLRRFRKMFAFCPKGFGKANCITTPLPTPAGWTTMGDIKVGDQVFDERGRPCDVIAATQVMYGRPCYRVSFDDGTSLVADAEHQWFTEKRFAGPDAFPRRKGRIAAWRFGLRTTAEIAATLRNSNGKYQSANHSIALTQPLVLPDAALPIEPYVLGQWLGNGDADQGRLTVGAQDIDETRELLQATGTTLGDAQPTHTAYRVRLGGLSQQLRATGVWQNKHVPSAYLRGSAAQRLALLQGLMDTDGYIDDVSGQCEFCTTTPALATGAYELLVSLGIKATMHEGDAKLYGRVTSRKWRIFFHPDPDLPVFRLGRKRARQVWRHHRRRLSGDRRITACEPIPSVPVRCISVSSPSQLYLAGRSMVPTHNSPVGAGLAIYLARCDNESAAEVYAVAADRENAKIVHDNAKIMVEHSPSLAVGSEILRDSIVWAATHSSLKVLSSDASTKHGFRPHGVIFDELHAQKNRDLYEALKKSMVKRRQPLMIIITHAGTDDEGICREEYDLAKRVLSGSTDVETTLPVIFEIGKGEDWTDPVVWQRVNPGHGHTVKHDAIVDECQEALAEPRKRNDFMRYHLNQWTNQATAWIPIDWWDACEASTLTPTVDEAELVTLPCAAGLDLAQKWDLACFCVCFRKYLDRAAVDPIDVVATDETSEAIVKKTISLNYLLIVRPYFWIPEETMWQHEKEDGVPYTHWAELGLVTPTEGITIDYTKIYTDITTKILPRYPKLKQGLIGYDPAFATDIATKLRDLAGLQVLEVLQNYKMISEPSQIVEALLKGKRVRHDGHRVLRSHWENATIKTDDARRIRPVKPKNATKRIDGVIAMIMGEKVLSVQPRPPEYQMFFLGGR